MRGRETIVICDACGRKIPRNKAVAVEKPINLGVSGDLGNVRLFEKRKVYYCISCAKHRGIFEMKKRMNRKEERYE
ncbi:MAG: hypothetical protein ARM1_0838 [Candidatus Micrarchaeota archaeon]|nr:MAG: hypothetical protein ARM1_0838 [Candidatus Micrarchaeota archaeon]